MTRKKFWDITGMFLSGLCVIHCLALPLIVIFLPAITTAFIPDEGLVHGILFFLIIGVAGLAFIPGYRFHRKFQPLIWLSGGLMLLTFATFFAHDFGHYLEPIFAIPGSICIIMAHYLNHKSCKHMCGEHQHRFC